jgi:hypothetical protein
MSANQLLPLPAADALHGLVVGGFEQQKIALRAGAHPHPVGYFSATYTGRLDLINI